MNGYCSTDTTEDGPIYLEEISCTPESKAEWFSGRCDQLNEMLRESAAQCREKDAELDRLRKIAACFQKGDAETMANIAERFDVPCPDGIPCGICAIERDCVHRLQAAAKLAEDSCK